MLKSEDMFFYRSYAGPIIKEFEIDVEAAMDRNQIRPPMRCFKGKNDFDEIEGVFTEEEARQEAERCYSCGRPEGHYRNCWFCLPCEVVCPEKALWVEIPYLLR
jgi:formate dehydrogenase major subunit